MLAIGLQVSLVVDLPRTSVSCLFKSPSDMWAVFSMSSVLVRPLELDGITQTHDLVYLICFRYGSYDEQTEKGGFYE